MRIVATSDTHFPFAADRIPEGDLFLHAGDLMYTGYVDEWNPRVQSLAALEHKRKYLCPGNHDFHIQNYMGVARAELRKQANTRVFGVPGTELVEVDGVRILGIPYVTGLQGWAFGAQEEWLLEHLNQFSDTEIDVVVSHAPVFGILDVVNPEDKHHVYEHVGGLAMNRWFYAKRQKPKVWIHGHIHESYGRKTVEDCTFYNVAMCDRGYSQENSPMIIDL